jgi:hypothetical protein
MAMPTRAGVRHPGAVVAVGGFALLVRAHLGERGVVRLFGSFLMGICAAMPPMAKHTALVAGLDAAAAT